MCSKSKTRDSPYLDFLKTNCFPMDNVIFHDSLTYSAKFQKDDKMEIWLDIWDIVPAAALRFCAAFNFRSQYSFQGK